MSRWDYDTVFYRVFCITLLCVAFTFTVILTNVFVDIDGILSNKDKGKAKPPAIQNDISEVMKANMLADDVIERDTKADTSEDVYDDKDYQDSTDLYRSKRSLESPEIPSKIKDQRVKTILTNHLATLLDELDEGGHLVNNKHDKQESANDINVYKIHKSIHKNENNHRDKQNDKNNEIKINLQNDKKKTENMNMKIKGIYKESEKLNKIDDIELVHKYEELLHPAINNVILKGVIGSMNLNFYGKLDDLVKNLESDYKAVMEREDFKTLIKVTTPLQRYLEDETLLEEVLKELNSENKRWMNKNRSENKVKEMTTTPKPDDHNVMIKTLIDINTQANEKTNNESNSNSTNILDGAIKFIYNGKSIKFKRVNDSTTNDANQSNNSYVKASKIIEQDIEHGETNHHGSDNHIRNSDYKKIMNYYLKKIVKDSNSLEHDKIFSRKRLKRHIKIRYDQDRITEKPKNKKEDDELFVEIETHFDSKGTKGEKKKKMIRDLIAKIQNAIHSDSVSKKRKQKHWHVKKRTQDPLSSRSAATLINKLILPLETIAHRHIDPISKAIPAHEDMPLVSDVRGHNHWRRKYRGPRFFAKSINSAEMNTVDVDYNKIMTFNGIPQRLQKPINTDMSVEALQESNVVDLGNIKFLMKDVDGSGFTIGFNQYTDEAPDPESMKLFDGIENIIKTYHQKYDQESVPDTQQQNFNDYSENINPENISENEEYLQTDKQDEHSIARRSIKDSDEQHQHSNEYKAIYERNFLPFNSYQDIYKSRKEQNSNLKKHYKTFNNISSLILNDNLFMKKLKPYEILSIANLFERRKRSMTIKKISNLRIKNNMNKYLNTNSMATRKIFLNKKRNKRQVDKIRIVARDLPDSHKHLEEDFFVVSDEKVFADRALVREMQVPETEPNDKYHSVEHYDFISPQQEEDIYGVITQPEKDSDDHYDVVSPYAYEPSVYETQNNEFTRRARHNSLMSRYPHIIMEGTSRSKEEVYPEEQYAYENVENTPAQRHVPEDFKSETDNSVILPTLDMHSDNIQEYTKLIPAPKDKSNYKLTVKIRPKNVTGMAGFKEVHTSINKSYNRNGLIYTSLVNVSELSKVEKAHKNMSARRNALDNDGITNLNQQQQLIQSLIRQHKRRIDEQLRQLHIEKSKLESINVDNIESSPDPVVEVGQPFDPKQSGHLIKEDLSKLLKIDVTTTPESSTTVIRTISTESTTLATTTSSTTTEFVQPTTEDSNKIKMIQTIERNENVTNEILKKIDQNTSVLKIFLGKLLAKIDVPSVTEKIEVTTTNIIAGSYLKTGEKQAKDKDIDQNNNNLSQKQFRIENNPYNLENYRQNLPTFFLHNMQRQLNNSMGIPFVYAIQKPYSVTNKEIPVANVIYQGHIHTNVNDKDILYKTDIKPDLYKPGKQLMNTKPDIKDNLTQKPLRVENKDAVKEFWQPNPGEKVLHNFVMQNNSRFFIDALENDYKVLPLGKTDYKSLGVTGNVTNV